MINFDPYITKQILMLEKTKKVWKDIKEHKIVISDPTCLEPMDEFTTISKAYMWVVHYSVECEGEYHVECQLKIIQLK